MRRILWAAVLLACILCLFGFSQYQRSAPPMRGPVVKLLVNGGHGSAVHIGDGYLVTAAHVVKDKITAKLDDDSTRETETLWVNAAYDIALLRIKDYSTIASANLACRVPTLNEDVFARGNPLRMEWITTRGWVAGKTLEVLPAWRSVIPLSLPLAGGMSGGGLFDSRGDLVGILVGAPLQPIGFGTTLVGISYAVDGRSICNLLARS